MVWFKIKTKKNQLYFCLYNYCISLKCIYYLSARHNTITNLATNCPINIEQILYIYIIIKQFKDLFKSQLTHKQ